MVTWPCLLMKLEVLELRVAWDLGGGAEGRTSVGLPLVPSYLLLF